jgi:threonine/homoserine/homoserine lactone efflux protein
MPSEFTYIISGIVFGLGAGLTPGPLMTLVITETLKHGTREGIKVSMAPLITDFPIIVISIYLISEIANFNNIIGIISLAGAGYLIYLGYESMFFKGVDIDVNRLKPQSVRKGILANVLNPNPYIFWISVGAPMILKAAEVSTMAVFLFIFLMYFCLVGSKVLTAYIIGKSRHLFKSKNYILLLRGLGLVLLFFALIFLIDGLRYLGIV